MSFLNPAANPLSSGAPFAGASAFGFEIPLGDPGGIESAAGATQRLGRGFEDQARTLGVGARVATGADGGGWEGSASGAFAAYVGHLNSALSANVQACESAAASLTALAQALTHAQAVTRQALADCERAHGEMQTQQGLADGYGRQATAANAQAAAAVHPAVASQYLHQANTLAGQQGGAQRLANAAANELSAAQTRGRTAYEAYVHEATALSRRLASAAGALRNAPSLPGGSAPIPITSTATDISLAAGIARQIAAGKLTGPAVNALTPLQRTPGAIAALLADERNAVNSALGQGGARGPYGPWTHNQFLNPATVNSMVDAGQLPPMPSNWGSMSDPQRAQYLKALGPYFSGLGCQGGGLCSFAKATGTGTRSVPEVLHTLSRWGELTAIGVCAVGSDGACLGAVKLAFVGDSASNVVNASSLPNLFAREGVTAIETVVGGGSGLIAAKLGKAGLLEHALPSSTLGQTGLKIYFTAPGAVVTVVTPRIDKRLFPDPGPSHGHSHP